MKTKAVSTRRGFFWKAGAALSVPLTVATAGATQSSVEDSDALKARLAKLDDMNAIRALHQAYARHVNAREHEEVVKLFTDPVRVQVDESISSLSAECFGEQDVIELAADRKTATARFHCTVQAETAIGPDCTLVDMARQQGDGVLRRSQSCVLETTCVKQGGVWKIERSAYRSA